MDELLVPKTSDEPSKSAREENPFSFSSLDSPWERCRDTRILIPDAISPRLISRPTSKTSFLDLLSNFSKQRTIKHRSHSAPSVFTDIKEPSPGLAAKEHTLRSTPPIVNQAFVGIILYMLIVVLFYVFKSNSFNGETTFRLVDALYFSVVTLCTIGYGDIVPATTFTKLFTCAFILVGFGFIDILLHGLVTYMLDKQEAVLLSTVDERWRNVVFRTYVMDMKKGRMRIRMKVGLALAVVAGCILVGMAVVRLLEGLSWVDCFYLSVTSVTTVGYGDYAFKTLKGRLFATVWLLVSTLAVARAFLYLTELRIDKRNRKIANWVLQKKFTVGDLVAADLDNDGSIRYTLQILYEHRSVN